MSVIPPPSSDCTAADDTEVLPVIIAGAGPCGLVVALTLQQQQQQQQQKLPFVILERASRNKFQADVGSGFDLSLTAIDILRNRLRIDNIEAAMTSYAGISFTDTEGRSLRNIDFSAAKLPVDVDLVSASRSGLQKVLFDALLAGAKNAAKNAKEERKQFNEMVLFDAEVVGYKVLSSTSDRTDKKKKKKKIVQVELKDGRTIKGRILLGCDGIHSQVRQCMVSEQHLGLSDPLHNCNITCWWGKVRNVRKGSDLHDAVQRTQKYPERGISGVWGLGTSRYPGNFLCAPLDHGTNLAWVICTKDAAASNAIGDDLARRGGKILNEMEKAELVEQWASSPMDLIHLVLDNTDASDITRVGLLDRENMSVPYIDEQSRLVALLGDAAHPQAPFMGQGVNMAIVDAYLLGTLLVANSGMSMETALDTYNDKSRRKSVNAVIRQARSYGDLCLSKNWFVCWIFRKMMKYMPLSMVIGDMIKGDESNKNFMSSILSQSKQQ